MDELTEIKDEEPWMENGISILKIRAKEYEKDLNQVVSTPTPKWKKKTEMIVFMKCSDHVATSSNLWLDENAQCFSCIKSELLQILKPGAFPRNCNVITFLMTKRMLENFDFGGKLHLRWGKLRAISTFCVFAPTSFVFSYLLIAMFNKFVH